LFGILGLFLVEIAHLIKYMVDLMGFKVERSVF